MKKFRISQKWFNCSLLCGMLCAIFLSLSSFNTACDDLRGNVLRLHIIANSNSESDQQLKLKIRDSILAESENLFSHSESVEDAVSVAENSLAEIEKIANRVIKENNFNYKATAAVKQSYFETREYDDFTLPAGDYESLVINLGKSEGKNWWCVIFPEICLPSASGAKLSDTVNQNSADIAESKDRYIMKFKIVEIYEDFKKSLTK